MHRAFKNNVTNKAGFSLIELIVVIAVIAILAGTSTIFIPRALEGYANSENYFQLVDMSDNALRRIKRDVRNAVPNSARISADGRVLEFVPIVYGGRYRAGASSAAGGGNPLDFGLADDSFDVLGPPVPQVSPGDGLVIYNMGIAGANMYEGDDYRALVPTGNLAELQFSGPAFPYSSPGRRFYIVRNAMLYVCDPNTNRLLMYSDYPVVAGLPTGVADLAGFTPHVIAEFVGECGFRLDNGVMQHSGVLSMTLQIQRNNASVRLFHMIDLVNSA